MFLGVTVLFDTGKKTMLHKAKGNLCTSVAWKLSSTLTTKRKTSRLLEKDS